MTSCLFLAEYPEISALNERGGTALCYGHLQLLSHANVFVKLVVFLGQHEIAPDSLERAHLLAKIRSKGIWVSEIYYLPFVTTNNRQSSIFSYARFTRDPAILRYGDLLNSARVEQVQELVTRVAPDFIWAEDLIPATLAERSSMGIPVVFSHYDWKWRIKRHRAGEETMKIKKRLLFWAGRQHEEMLVGRVTGCISASITETDEIRHLGAKRALYIPTIYSPISLDTDVSVHSQPRIVHLGGMATTANRLGLQRFLEVSWPIIQHAITPAPELWIVGSLDGATPQLVNALQQKGIVCTGFVSELSLVLRPFDLHIVPWEHNTGTRTRIPLALNYAQVLIAIQAAASCLPELKNDRNCFLVENLRDMSQTVVMLLSTASERKRIAEAGRQTFLSNFTRESQQLQFNSFLDDVLQAKSGTVI